MINKLIEDQNIDEQMKDFLINNQMVLVNVNLNYPYWFKDDNFPQNFTIDKTTLYVTIPENMIDLNLSFDQLKNANFYGYNSYNYPILIKKFHLGYLNEKTSLQRLREFYYLLSKGCLCLFMFAFLMKHLDQNVGNIGMIISVILLITVTVLNILQIKPTKKNKPEKFVYN